MHAPDKGTSYLVADENAEMNIESFNTAFQVNL